MMIDDKKTMLFGAYTGRLWNDLPHIFEASIYHTPTPRTFIIYSAQSLLQAYIRTGYDPEDDFSLENLLMSIMRVLKHSIEAKADSETVVQLLHCVNEVVKLNPDIKLSDALALADLLKILALNPELTVEKVLLRKKKQGLLKN